MCIYWNVPACCVFCSCHWYHNMCLHHKWYNGNDDQVSQKYHSQSIILNHSVHRLSGIHRDSCKISVSTHRAWRLAMFCCVHSTSPFLAWSKQLSCDHGHMVVNVSYFLFVLAWWCGDSPYQFLQCEAKDSVCPPRKGMNEEWQNILTNLPSADKKSCSRFWSIFIFLFCHFVYMFF